MTSCWVYTHSNISLADVPYFLLQLFDGRMHMQKVYQQVQMKQCVFHYYPEDVIAVIKELNIETLSNLQLNIYVLHHTT